MTMLFPYAVDTKIKIQLYLTPECERVCVLVLSILMWLRCIVLWGFSFKTVSLTIRNVIIIRTDECVIPG